jgi:hypothetical protein
MLHSDMAPEHCCDGDLIQLKVSTQYLRVVRCSACGTEFTYVPDSSWVTMVLPGMRN